MGDWAYGAGCEKPRHRLVRLSKIEYYHKDNIILLSLSGLNHAVKKKRGCGFGG